MKSELITAIDSLWNSGGVIRVIGLAGSGKTFSLAEAMFWAHIEKGVPLTRIVFVSFTRAAIQEVRHKLKIITEGLLRGSGNRITFSTAQIATIHSWCWQNLLKDSADLIKDAGFYSPEQFAMEKSLGEENVVNLNRALMLDFLGDEDELRGFVFSTPSPGALFTFIDEYKETKGSRVDYNDILWLALDKDEYKGKIDLLLVDESQDLTELQWRIVVKHLYANAKVTVVAGDLTQSIYLWNGAAPELWLGAEVDKELVMNESRRIPADLLPLINLCIADDPSSASGSASKKIACHPSNTKKGEVRVCNESEAYEYLHQKSDDNKEALVLTLSNSNIRAISNKMIQSGILFSRSDSYGKDGFGQIITKDDWLALKLYYSLLNDEPDTEKTHADVSRMLRRSKRFTKKWRKVIGVVEGLGGRGEGSQRQYNERHGNDKITLVDLTAQIELTPGDFFDDCFAQKRVTSTGSVDLFMNKRYYSMHEYYDRCYQGPYMEPKIKLSTVHGAKGLESDCVILFVFGDRRWDIDERLKLYLNAMCRSSGELIITGEYSRLFYDILGVAPDPWIGAT